MKIRTAMIVGCALTFCLSLAVAISSGALGESKKSERSETFQRSHSDLEQDQRILDADMRQLRRDLRRGVGGMRIFFERDEIREDWLNIVTERGLKRDKAPSPLDLARASVRARRHALGYIDN
jgi:hypothetical protein